MLALCYNLPLYAINYTLEAFDEYCRPSFIKTTVHLEPKKEQAKNKFIVSNLSAMSGRISGFHFIEYFFCYLFIIVLIILFSLCQNTHN